MLLALLPLSAAAKSEKRGELQSFQSPAWIAALGLQSSRHGWTYVRGFGDKRPPRRRALSLRQSQILADFLSSVDPENTDLALARYVENALRGKHVPAKHPAWVEWFEPGEGPRRLTRLGKNAVPDVVLGDPFGDKKPAGPGRVSALAAGANTGGRKNGVALSLNWGSGPRHFAHGKTIESLYNLYGYGTDSLFDGVLSEESRKGKVGRVARTIKSVADLVFARTLTVANHEIGHAEKAYLGGARDIAWVKRKGGFAFGRVLEVGHEDYMRMSPAQRQAFIAGGTLAVQASVDAMRRRLLAEDDMPWSALPLYFANKIDYTAYAFTTPKPHDGPHAPHDIRHYRDGYAARSGRSRKSLHRELRLGALWNMLDPMAFWSISKYATEYVTRGKRRLSNPMKRIAGREYMASPGFWLSEVGPQYRLSVLSRNPQTRSIVQVSPTVGDDGQWSVEAEMANLSITERIKARFFSGVWKQRRHAEPGVKRKGGSLGGGFDLRISKRASVSATGGYKTRGALLGRPFDKGAFFEVGTTVRF